MKYTEAKLEEAVIQLFQKEGYTYLKGEQIQRTPEEVLLKAELKGFLRQRYAPDNIKETEINTIIRKLEMLSAADLYDSNKTILKWIADGFILKREDHTEKDLYIQFIDYDTVENNDFKIVNQFEIVGTEKRIPDALSLIHI